MVFASVASMLAVKSISFWPMPSLRPQRLSEATPSSAVTGVPSCHFQTVAQSEGVGELVIADFPVGHLRLDLEVGVFRQQRVIDHVAVIAGDVGGGEAGIDHAQIGMP